MNWFGDGPSPNRRLLAYPWSSWGWYLVAPEHRPAWLRVDRLLGEHGLRADTAEARQELERRMEEVRARTRSHESKENAQQMAML